MAADFTEAEEASTVVVDFMEVGSAEGDSMAAVHFTAGADSVAEWDSAAAARFGMDSAFGAEPFVEMAFGVVSVSAVSTDEAGVGEDGAGAGV